MAGKKLKKFMAALLAGVMVLSMTACGSGKTSGNEGAAAEEAEEGALVVGIYSGIDTLNPWANGRIMHDMVTYMLYETLASRQGGATDLDYILMKGYEQIDDTTYNVEIYDYIKDAEGNSITASDVVFSFEQYMANWATDVESISAIDDYHVQLKMNSTAEGTFEYIVCKVPIASEKAYNDSPDQFATTSCGTMPYTVAGGEDYVNGSKIIARKTDSYWQTDESLIYPGSVANSDVIQLDIIEESTQMALAIEEGTVSFAQYLDPQLLDEVKSRENLEVFPLSAAEDRGILFCMTEESPFYDNLALRQAVLYAIDNEAVAEACGYGYATPSKVSCGDAELTIGYDSSWETEPYAYDPEKAKELLTEAGYDAGELTIRCLCNDNQTITTMWTIIQANLQEVGINAELNVCEGTTYGSYRDGTSGQYDLAYPGPGNDGYVTGDLWKTLFNRNNYSSGRTMGGGLDDELQALYDAIAAPDGYTQENLNAFYEYITDNALYYQIYSLPFYGAYDKDKIADYYTDYNRFVRPNTIVVK